jgi:hypothetical protein
MSLEVTLLLIDMSLEARRRKYLLCSLLFWGLKHKNCSMQSVERDVCNEHLPCCPLLAIIPTYSDNQDNKETS